MIDRRPGLIARCKDSGQVAHAVRFARDHELLVAIRRGGHNIAVNAVCEGGLMIDLSLMQDVQVHPARRIARVEPGCTLADVDHETQAHGLALPTGINSTTGIAGLALDGEFGWSSRQQGMTADNLLSGLIVHPFEDAAEVLEFYRGFAATLPDETAVWVVTRKAPPLPFLPEKWHGREVVALAAFHGGDMQEGERVLEPLRRFGRPIADVVGPHPCSGWQQPFDPLLAPGARNYWKSHDFLELNDALLDALIRSGERLPSPHREIFIAQVGGAMSRVAPNATAYPHREAEFIMNVHARWEDPADEAACTRWARVLFREAAPYATGGVYVDLVPEDETDRIGGAYGANYDRLVALKDRYDPGNLFRMNQNIRSSDTGRSGQALAAAPLPA